MTNTNIIQAIKAEIERLKNNSELAKMEWVKEGYNQNAFAEDCRISSFDKLLSFISTIESEKQVNLNDDLNFALDKYIGELDEELRKEGCTYEFDWDDITETIREAGTHFAKWGAEHLKK